jgi:NAD(P)-dependent dehydrogenase (short-subunit alcohol dehydrogenase family)
MPGPTWTEGVETFIAGLAAERGIGLGDMQTAFFAEGDWSSSLIGRFLDPAEPAAVVAFLASDAAIGVNGAAWRAEGGVTRSTLLGRRQPPTRGPAASAASPCPSSSSAARR